MNQDIILHNRNLINVFHVKRTVNNAMIQQEVVYSAMKATMPCLMILENAKPVNNIVFNVKVSLEIVHYVFLGTMY